MWAAFRLCIKETRAGEGGLVSPWSRKHMLWDCDRSTNAPRLWLVSIPPTPALLHSASPYMTHTVSSHDIYNATENHMLRTAPVNTCHVRPLWMSCVVFWCGALWLWLLIRLVWVRPSHPLHRVQLCTTVPDQSEAQLMMRGSCKGTWQASSSEHSRVCGGKTNRQHTTVAKRNDWNHSTQHLSSSRVPHCTYVGMSGMFACI